MVVVRKKSVFFEHDKIVSISIGKDSHTDMERISYNGATSLVKCTPYTGRTHQIRVHLQWLGYPIVNDPKYNR